MDVTLQNKYFYLPVTTTWTAAIFFDTATINIASLPAWITGIVDGANGLLYLEFDTTGVSAGTYTYNLTAFSIVVTVRPVASEEMPACCTDAVEVKWLNREGGWQNMLFAHVKDNEIRQSGAQTYINDLTVKYSSKGRIYDGARLAVDVFNQSQYDYLIGIKSSIQAFIDGEPILIDQESFPTYSKDTRIFEFSFNFIYAKEKLYQTQ